VVALALRSGISVREWLDGDERELSTALHLMDNTEAERIPRGPQMSG
jgi:hypothetical protein